MKQSKNAFWLLALLFLLGCSCCINIWQNSYIDRLVNKVNDLEYLQSVMSYQIDQLERQGGADEYAD